MDYSYDEYFTIIPHTRFTKNKLEFLFNGVSFQNKTVIDIGCGDGRHGLFAALNGARKVVFLEPSLDGSSKNIVDKFLSYKKRYNLDNIDFYPLTLQQYYEKTPETFDIILSHNSINHFDEPACINLKKDPGALQKYQNLAQMISSLAKPGSMLIIADCTSQNLFAHLPVKNPLAATIEWYKHQAPEEWVKVFTHAGFSEPEVHWTISAIFRNSGISKLCRYLLDNRYVSYVTIGHFTLFMRKKENFWTQRINE